MSALIELYRDQLLLFVLVLTRISTLVMTAPIFGSRNVPIRVRAFVAIGFALIVTPLHFDEAREMPVDLVNLAVLVAREAVLGLALGLAVMILFTGLHLTGQVIGQMSGMALADTFDPTFDSSVPVFTQLLDAVTLSVFIAIGGHRQIMAALLDTFRWRPPGVRDFPTSIVDTFTQVTSESFVVGIRAGAPVMVALFLAVLILGLISRTLPQLNVIAVGFSLNSMVMMLTLAAAMSGLAWVVQDHADSVIATIRDSIVFDRPPT
ncbi:MAG: flagellar biosynthetic protein FliR [Planctomycetaceae bacterium]|nr:flagellar biosynthetic protein FliR [Planctomycetales bacterium]MCB9924796.1 flagellar biosynthetic protein FliR [Planctomycetaceae bacterium]